MPLNVRRFYTFIFLIFSISISAFAQTSADVMRERVVKAKAFIAVKNYNAAIYELENIRRETKEPAVNSVINVLLINSYLEQSDYKRAQEFLKELSDPKKPVNSASYFAVAGQVVKCARNQVERYRSLGLSVSDRNLPLEAITDVEKMRETLELVVDQSKVLAKDKAKTSDVMALLEEATNARSNLARDDFDASRWKNEISDAREQLANSRSVVVDAVDGTTTSTAISNTSIASNNTPTTANIVPVSAKPTETNSASTSVNATAGNSKTPPVVKDNPKPPTETIAKIENPVQSEIAKATPKKADEPVRTTANDIAESPQTQRNQQPANENQPLTNAVKTEPQAANNLATSNTNSPLSVGSLMDYVTQRVNPVYPQAARTVRMSGVVKVDVVVDEDGRVAEVQKTSGPSMLQRAAADAVRRWKFKPFTRDGQPIKATGFINFNFAL